MKQPKNQKELLILLAEQNAQLEKQDGQIRTLKQALLRLEQKLNKVSVVADRAQDNARSLNERVKRTEVKLLQS